jgi:peptidoglycan/xylan/chitin deacetylase (PgdA/CDA1 family)
MLALALVVFLSEPGPGNRTVAVTLDDLPGTGARGLQELKRMNRRVLAALRAAGAPAVGFVNEAKLQVTGERDARAEILRSWLDAGMTLGNHGHGHQDLSRILLRDYQDDVLRGEVVTRALLEERKLPLVYYRHPYTHTGPTAEVKQAFERFLEDRKYKVAPFTIEHSDWVFAALYSDAAERGASRRVAAVRASYLDYFERMCTWFEELSRDTFGREIPQILLTHVNGLNADALPEVLSLLRKRGYRFITLDQALADEAYRTPDQYVASNGPSWLHRWRLARKLPPRLKDEPDLPTEIMEAWQARRARASRQR